MTVNTYNVDVSGLARVTPVTVELGLLRPACGCHVYRYGGEPHLAFDPILSVVSEQMQIVVSPVGVSAG